MKTVLTGWFCLLLSGAALAATPAPEQAVQASMLVTGSIVVAPDGHVAGYAIDKADRVPTVVRKLLAQAIPSWSFEPVLRDGKAVEARSNMTLRIVAKPRDDGKVSIGVAGAQFASDGPTSDDITYRYKKPPVYPRDAAMESASATVFILLSVDRQGKVDDVATEQVNLKTRGSPHQMDRWRKLFSNAALAAARHWTFNMPTSGDLAGREHVLAQVAVNFQITGNLLAFEHYTYGKWQPYIPGPRQPIPWIDTSSIANNADVLPAGGLAALHQGGLHLITHLGS
jgi:outer membrane biosynthesis protein TonB